MAQFSKDEIIVMISRMNETLLQNAQMQEARIDRLSTALNRCIDETQNIVKDLSHTADRLTEVYSTHLEKLQKCRDRLVVENTKLTEVHLLDRSRVKEMSDRLAEMREKEYKLLEDLAKRPQFEVSNKQL